MTSDSQRRTPREFLQRIPPPMHKMLRAMRSPILSEYDRIQWPQKCFYSCTSHESPRSFRTGQMTRPTNRSIKTNWWWIGVVWGCRFLETISLRIASDSMFRELQPPPGTRAFLSGFYACCGVCCRLLQNVIGLEAQGPGSPPGHLCSCLVRQRQPARVAACSSNKALQHARLIALSEVLQQG